MRETAPFAILEGPSGRAFALVWDQGSVVAVERDDKGDFTGDPDAATLEEIGRVLAGLDASWGPLGAVDLLLEDEAVRHAVIGAFAGAMGDFAVLARGLGAPPLLVRVLERGPVPVTDPSEGERFRDALAAGVLASSRQVQDALMASTAVKRGRPVEWLATSPPRVVVQEALLDERRLVRASTGGRDDPGDWFEKGADGLYALASVPSLDEIGRVVEVEVRGAVRRFAIEAVVSLYGQSQLLAVPIEGEERGWIALDRVDGRLEPVRTKKLLEKIDESLGAACFLDRERGPLGLARSA